MEGKEPAFPSWETLEKYDNDQGKYVEAMVPVGGLSKREWLAGMAMQGMLASNPTDTTFGLDDIGVRVADKALECADALLAALSQSSVRG